MLRRPGLEVSPGGESKGRLVDLSDVKMTSSAPTGRDKVIVDEPMTAVGEGLSGGRKAAREGRGTPDGQTELREGGKAQDRQL